MKNPRLTLTQQSWTGEYSDDPLAAVRQAAGQLFDYDAALRRRVQEARLTGATWQDVGDVLSTTRQAAQQRFG